MFDFVSFIPRAVVQGIPLLLGSTGETLTEKSGNLNLGIPGIMYVGGISGVIGSFYYEAGKSAQDMNTALAILIPLGCCLLGSLLMGGHAAGKPERHRPCADHLRRGLRQLFRRIAY